MAETEDLDKIAAQPEKVAVASDNGSGNAQEKGEESADLRASNFANLKKVGTLHGVALVASLTLFGAAQTWANGSGLMLASGVAIAAAFIAGMALSSLFHEWGHYSGAALSGSTIKVIAKPADYVFFLGFNPHANSTRQALWLSWGGLSGSWLLVASVALLVPMDSWPSAVLLATVLGRAVNASVFEVPIALRTQKSREFSKELKARLKSPGIVQIPGLIVGLAVLAFLT